MVMLFAQSFSSFSYANAGHLPSLLVRREGSLLRRSRIRFFVSSGPGHGAVTTRATVRFAWLLRALGLLYRLELFREKQGAWERQLVAGLIWAERPDRT